VSFNENGFSQSLYIKTVVHVVRSAIRSVASDSLKRCRVYFIVLKGPVQRRGVGSKLILATY